MYSVDEQDDVMKLDDMFKSEHVDPHPIILGHERMVLLAYRVETPSLWVGSSGTVWESERTETLYHIVEFKGCLTYTFGAPGKDNIDMHPLAERGLHAYGAFHIFNSSWIRQLEREESKANPNYDTGRFKNLGHNIYVFHDGTFECVSKTSTYTEHEGSLESILQIMRGQLNWW